MVEKSLKHVIQCMPDGSIQMTLKDKELKPFNGHRQIDRMTEILFDETLQKFYVLWRFSRRGITDQPMQLFDTYEDAIDYEVQMINKARLTGTDIESRL